MINNKQDAEILQKDLDSLQEWERDWQMAFNPGKCEHIRITNKKRPIISTYCIHSKALSETRNAKYLGVTHDSNLTFNSHINSMTRKANNTTAFLQRNLSSCPRDIKATCYKSLIRPQLEYAATVWDPITKTNINKVEAVQRRAARFCHNDYHRTSSVTTMLQDLG